MKTVPRGRKNVSAVAASPLLQVVRRHLQERRLPEAKEAAAGLLASARSGPALVALGRAIEPGAGSVEGRLVLGVALREVKRAAGAELVLRDGLSERPGQPALLLELGNALADLDRREEAVAALEQAIRSAPEYAPAHYNLGNMLRQAGRAEEAVAAYESAIRRAPSYAEAHYNLGIVLQQLRQPAPAVASYRRAAELHPGHFGTRFNLGGVLQAERRFAEAADVLRQAVALRPGHAEAHCRLGDSLRELKRLDEAAAAYRSALALAPDDGAAQVGLACVLRAQDRFAEAETLFRARLRRSPDDVEVEERLAELLHGGNRLAEARAVYDAMLDRQPDHPAALAGALQLKSMVCDWRNRDAEFARLLAVTDRQIAVGQRTALSAFDAFARPLPPATLLAIARTWAAETEILVACDKADLAFDVRCGRHDRLRVAYVSSDFKNHATGHLVQGLFRAHDREAFEIFAVSHGRDDGSVYRRRIAAEAEHFLDVAPLTDRDAAALLHRAGIDILVDLNGYTRDHRLGIAALRPAPIVATWLGFPGSCGAAFIDYAIVDRIVAPPEEAHRFTERLVHLPHCYQINDRDHPIDDAPLARRGAGLPDDGVVFCCFNASFKIEPVIFDVWMRILHRVAGSVLWLLQPPGEGADSLRREAASRGVDPARLVFAAKQGKAQHLARHRLADLFLDTRWCGAHTTCSDALLAGLPVLTCPGETFAARVAASLLLAAGLPELIMRDFAAYEARAVALAQQPDELRRLRDRLRAARWSSPAFDVEHLVRGLERAYRWMWEIRENDAGSAPHPTLPSRGKGIVHG
jgi:predicted O-linked N-acetylglucosamine transferase (SPINDLY family)